MAAVAIAGCGGEDETSTAASSTSTAAPPTTAERPPPDDNDNGDEPPTGDGRGGVALEQVGTFDQPVYVTQPVRGDDGHLYVVEQCGKVERVPIDGGEPTTFLDITEEVTCGGEQGLLSIAFDPDYERNGRFYVNHTDLDGNSATLEYSRSNPDDPRELLTIEDFASNHNGGLLQFGPDGELYLGMGDGGGGGDPERTAQNPESPLGKLLRLDRDRPGDYELAALGLRNPWRYSFDSDTDALWIGDVGQDSLEEIDAATRDQWEGGDPLNFGWSAFEGTESFNGDQQAPGAIEPVFEYGRDEGCSVSGGYVVRDPDLDSLYGRYLYGDFCQGVLRSFTADPSKPTDDDRPLGPTVASLSSFGEDASRHLYAVSLDGPVYRLVAEG